MLLALSLLMIVSGSVVAFAPNYLIFMGGHAVLGVAIGGFWSLSAATTMRLVPASEVPRALAILNGGNALATVVAAPLGSYLGALAGWRGAFFCVVPLAAAAVLLGLWGLAGTAAPVGWWTWLARTLPADAEAGGGLMVAVIQLAIMVGATLGGLLFDAIGYQATFGASAGLLLVSALLAWLAGRAAPVSAPA